MAKTPQKTIRLRPTIEIPVVDVPDDTFGTRPSDIGHTGDVRLSADQHSAVVRLRIALDGQHARLLYPAGRLVQTNADALRWLLERVSDAMNGKAVVDPTR